MIVCPSHCVFALQTAADLVTPVRIQASYSVLQFASSGDMQPAINSFSGDDPNRNLMIAVERVRHDVTFDLVTWCLCVIS